MWDLDCILKLHDKISCGKSGLMQKWLHDEMELRDGLEDDVSFLHLKVMMSPLCKKPDDWFDLVVQLKSK